MTKNELRDILRHEDTSLDVTFLVMPSISIMCVASAVDPLRAANRVSGRQAFTWRFVSPDGNPAVTTCGLPIQVSGPLEPSNCGDVLVMLAGFGVAVQATARLLSRIRQSARHVRAIGSVEAGSWLLARAGLLDGRAATTHWEDLEDFASAYPDTDVRRDRYIIDGPVFTAGGASPTFDLMLYLVRAHLGVATALNVAGVFIHEEGKAGEDAQPLIALGGLDNHDPRFAEALRLMESCIDRPLTAGAIAKRLRLSARGLEKLFKASTGETPGAYNLRLRLSIARRMVTDTSLTLGEVAERTGFSSAGAFSRAFSRVYGESPSAVRQIQIRSIATAMP